MKFAFVDGHRQEAHPNLKGACPACKRPVIAKCGEIRVWHWAHRGGRACDPWWEREREWHRDWKNQFPIAWQEFVQHSESGERHIADVKTSNDWVLEFQYSYIQPEERRAREVFYCPKLIWVVSGLRRKRDRGQFARAWNEGTPVGAKNSPVRRVFSDGCRLLQEWSGSDAHVFIDLGAEQGIWWLLNTRPNGQAYVACLSRSEFIAIHRGTAAQSAREFEAFVEDLGKFIENYEKQLRPQAASPSPLPARRTVIRRRRRL